MGMGGKIWGNQSKFYKCVCGRQIRGPAYWRHKKVCKAVDEKITTDLMKDLKISRKEALRRRAKWGV